MQENERKGEESEISENEKSEICFCVLAGQQKDKSKSWKWRKTADEQPNFLLITAVFAPEKRWSNVTFD